MANYFLINNIFIHKNINIKLSTAIFMFDDFKMGY